MLLYDICDQSPDHIAPRCPLLKVPKPYTGYLDLWGMLVIRIKEGQLSACPGTFNAKFPSRTELLKLSRFDKFTLKMSLV